MGERGVRNAEVRGSIPLISTIITITACRGDVVKTAQSTAREVDRLK